MTPPLQTYLSSCAKFIYIEHSEGAAKFIPHSLAKKGDKLYMKMDYVHDTCKVLANMGYAVSSPIMRHYNWPKLRGVHEATWFQKQTANFLVLNHRAAVFNKPGTMKTGSAIHAVEYLMQLGRVKRVLVLCPSSCVRTVWLNEIGDLVPFRRAGMMRATDKNTRTVEHVKKQEWLVTNHDGIKTFIDLIREFKPDVIILDESDKFNGHKTDRYKILRTLLQQFPHLMFWAMTGTPMPNAVTDTYALGHLINPTKMPRLFTTWRDMLMYKVSEFKWVNKPNALDVVAQYIQPAICMTREDCGIITPPPTRIQVKVPMTPEQTQAYSIMRNVGALEVGEGVKVVSANSAVRHSKLLQISLGFLYTEADEEDGRLHKIAIDTRCEACLPYIRNAKKKFIICSDYKGAVEYICEFLNNQGYLVASITGDTPQKKRDAAIMEFKNGELNGLVFHPETMSHGNTLVQADLLIFFNPPLKTVYNEQTSMRIDRPGQDTPPLIVEMWSTHVEKERYNTNQQRDTSQANQLKYYRELFKHEEF